MVQAAVQTATSIDQGKGDEWPWVGRSIERVEDAGLLSGRGRFIDDLGVQPGTLHAAILRSPHAHADILAIDTALAGAAVVVAGSLLHIPSTATTIAGAALCFGLRLNAIRRGWQLPTARPRKHFEKDH